MPLSAFHPAVADWFGRAFPSPTEAQAAAWPSIQAGRNTLVAAPTGSGKTLTAFMAALDGLVREGLEPGGLPDRTTVVYISPLKALSNDIQLNLDAPLAGIRASLAALGLPDVEIRTAVRTGDTPARERQQALRRPPHILVTTPESLYVLLGSTSGRAMLSTVRSVIVDEIHAVAASKRGSHLALTLERLEALCGRPLTRVALSATQKPIDAVARFLVGTAPAGAPARTCDIVDIGYDKRRDLALELPPTPLSAVMSNDQWTQVYARVAELVRAHRTTLVFVNTRRMAERAARHLGDLLGNANVAAHHGSLARETRLDAEQRLKRGELQVLVATASLELGLDIGDVDLVVQLGSPRSIASFLQRAGRAGHAVGGIPKARLFPQSRDELVECAALLEAIRRGELDALRIPHAPLDVLAQQIVAETACQEWDEDALFDLVRQTAPYAALPRADFDAVVRMVCDGYTSRNGPRAGYVHRDAVHRRLRERKGARLTALMSGGTIPETGDYTVMLDPEAHRIGSVNEDFAIESMAGDVFQLGNASYRILRIEPGRVRVEDGRGAPPNIPFWLGEAPGRTDELSLGVSRLREEVAAQLAAVGEAGTRDWLVTALALPEAAALQIVDYLGRALGALGALPTQACIVMERFFDASGGTQLVIHSPFGSRINRAWGLALRKRFCRTFNFELQAAATEDAIVMSLSTSHSFPLLEVSRYLHSTSALDVLVQALLDAPLFGVRWRWNATTALALPRFTGGRKVAPQLQRMKSEDLLATVFPDQVACAENLVGEREVPDHPLVAQTLRDCLTDAMDADGWLALLRLIEGGEVSIVALDLPAPSPLAAEALTARPYAFLDDVPLEERRTQAVQGGRGGTVTEAGDLGHLDPDAIDAVRREAWPEPRSLDEMHEALVMLAVLPVAEARRDPDWMAWLDALAADGRATCVDAHGVAAWVAAERLRQAEALYPAARFSPVLAPPTGHSAEWTAEDALRDVLRGRLGGLGPSTAPALADALGLEHAAVALALLALQADGFVMQGHFSPVAEAGGRVLRPVEWCERHLLARIHRYTLRRLRREIEPVEPREFARFLFDWQHVAAATQVGGPEALASVLAQLEGFEAPATSWEGDLLRARVRDYSPSWLDDLCTAGRTAWTRLRPNAPEATGRGAPSLRSTPIMLLPRRTAAHWRALAPAPPAEPALGSRAQRVQDYLAQQGASFFDEIAAGTHLLQVELEDALAALVVRGHVHCDSYSGLRALLVPPSKRAPSKSHVRRRAALPGIQDAGRWALVRPPAPVMAAAAPGAKAKPARIKRSRSLPPSPLPTVPPDAVEYAARTLLRRYGVVCWRMLEREAAWLPPWRDLVRVYHRLEARGEIRGGRFIAGLSGEQFALPDAVGLMRQVRRREPIGDCIVLAATDPANLLGTVLPGTRLPRVAGARALFVDGLPVATVVGDAVEWLQTLPAEQHAAAVRALAGAGLFGPADRLRSLA